MGGTMMTALFNFLLAILLLAGTLLTVGFGVYFLLELLAKVTEIGDDDIEKS